MAMDEDLRTRAIAAGVAEFHWDEVPQDTKLPFALAVVGRGPRTEQLEGYSGMRQTRIQI